MIVHAEDKAAMFAAFAKAQAEIARPVKDKAGYNYKYADLAATFDVALPVLNEHGFTLTQPASSDYSNDGIVVAVETYLLHESGGYIQFPPLVAKPAKAEPQAIGSAITYMRRYAFMSAVGIAPEDDDGAAAGAQPDKRPAQPKRRPDVNMKTVKPINPDPAPSKEDKAQQLVRWARNLDAAADAEPATDPQYKFLAGELDKHGDHKAILSTLLGRAVSKEDKPPKAVAGKLLDWILERVKDKSGNWIDNEEYNEEAIATLRSLAQPPRENAA